MEPYYAVGEYVCRITDHGLTKAASSGNDQVCIKFVVLGTPTEDGQYAPEDDQYPRTMWQAITPNTVERVLDMLESLGFVGSSWADVTNGSMVGKEARFYCGRNDWNNEIQEKWQLVHGDNGIPKTGDASNLDKLFGKDLRARFGGKTAAKPSPPQDTIPAPATDIPF